MIGVNKNSSAERTLRNFVGVGVADSQADIYDSNRRRIAFMSGFPSVELPQSVSGQQREFLPNGELMKFFTSQIGEATHSLEKNSRADKLTTRTAKEFMDMTINLTAQQAKGGTDYGIRALNMLVALEYQEEIVDGNRHIICTYELDDCPTCIKAHLESNELQKKIQSETTLDQNILIEMHKVMLNSVTASIAHANKMWSAVLAEYKAGTIKRIPVGADLCRKILHQVEPERQEANNMAELGRSIAEGINNNSGNNELERLRAENKRLQAKETETDKKLDAIMEQLNQKGESRIKTKPKNPFEIKQSVLVGKKKGIVTGKPFGKVTVQFEDGSKETVEVETVEADKVAKQ